jgi:8-oxo-dGTP diphosphatase
VEVEVAGIPTVAKVAAFVTSGDRLLVFRKPLHPGTGTQVPAGTVEQGESPEDAVIRECSEETGLVGFKLLRLLHHGLVDMRRFGRDELHDRWCFHLAPPPQIPEAWRHGEAHPSSGPDAYIPYDFFWMPLAEAERQLRAENHPALAALSDDKPSPATDGI